MSLRRFHPRRAHLHRWVIGLTVAAMVIAVLPVAAVLVTGVPGDGRHTAFAAAPSGAYVVIAHSEDDYDIISVIGAEDASFAEEIARIAHLPGYASTGAVSPDGALLALAVVDQGTLARPRASLVVVDLETAEAVWLLSGIDAHQRPVWSIDGSSVVVVRSTSGPAGTTVDVLQAPVDGGAPATLLTASQVLGVYPVGFDPDGALVSVRIDGDGSTALRGEKPVARLSPFITRDWSLSADGQQIAFIVVDQSSGLRYTPSVASLSDVGLAVAAQSMGHATEALGTAWAPGAGTATFGHEPAAGAGVSAQSAGGFDVPLAYSPDGASLAVRHWTGSSFADPGRPSFQVVTTGGRVTLSEVSRFYGWAER